MSGLLAAGVVSASMGVARADSNFAAACGGNGANGYVCNLDTTVPSPGDISVNVDSGAASESVNVNWTVSCADSSGTENQEGATDNASTPLNVSLAPLPATASDGNCNVNVGIKLSKFNLAKIAYTGTLTYNPAGSTTSPSGSAPVHPVVGFGGKCFSDKGNSSSNGAAVIIWSCSGSDQAENWKFTNNEFQHNNLCLNDKGNGGSGSKLILYSCNGGSNEKWSQLANGELKLQAHNGTLCVDDPRSSTTNGTQLIVYPCKDSANQRWSLP